MTPADLGAVRTLTLQLGYDITPELLRAQFERVAGAPEHHLVVALEGERVVGWMHAFGTQLLYYEPYVEIGALVVDDAVRRGGFGTALLREAEDWGREHGYAEIRVRSRLSRDEAHRFYVQLGYEKEKAQYTFTRRVAP
jgi:GNAT superfamily N-acetyltransferase